MCDLFKPQHEGNIITFRDVIYNISDRDGDFMPELEFPSDWLKPVLNSTYEKVLRENDVRFRYSDSSRCRMKLCLTLNTAALSKVTYKP